MDSERWNRDMIEDILSLLEFLQERGVPADRSTEPEVLQLLPEALRTAYEMMRFMDKIPGGFMIYRADGDERIVYANRGLLRIFRCDTWAQFQQLTNSSFRGLVHPEDLDEVEESIKRQIAESQYDLDYVEYRITRRDGSTGWIEDYGHFVHGERVGDFFYVFLGDATEKLERRQEERRRSERRYQGLIEEYDRERALIDQEHLRRLEVIQGLSVNYESILYARLEKNRILAYRLSQRTVRQFGEKYQMRELDWYLRDYVEVWVHPEDKEMVAKATAPAYIREKLAEQDTYYINFRVVCGGEVQYIQLRLVNVGDGGRVDQIVLGYRRVDEELQREMQQKQILAEALENANLAIVAKDEFLSNMSHNMHTPMNAIFGFMALARGRTEDPGLLDCIEGAERSGRQLMDMIDKVLELSWTGSRNQEAEQQCSLCQVLEEVCGRLRPKAADKGLAFELDCSGVEHSLVLADRDQLKQLAANLTDNAVTYTGPGGRVSVTLSEGGPGAGGRRTYRLMVADTGVGMSKEFLTRLFEPFARERDTTHSGVNGMGLGLTIAKYITDRMGGVIRVESTAGQGSVFTVELQLKTAEKLPAVRSGPAPEEEVPGQHILLVEDNEINREIEAEILRGSGFAVDTAEDGSVAVEMVKRSAPEGYDLILMDIQMPVMDGWQASRVIRGLEDPRLANIPIVALSANTLSRDMRRSMESGMDAHLTKPIDVPRLLEEIRRIAGRHKSDKNC